LQEQKEHMKTPIIKDDEIDLIEVARYLWYRKSVIIKVSVITALLGLLIGLGSKVEYQSSCTLLSENQENMQPDLGGLTNLAGLAGINLNLGNTNTLTPEMYPEIAQSTNFILNIWSQPIYFSNIDSTISSYRYFNDIYKPSIVNLIIKYSIGLPFQIKKWLTSESIQDKNEKSNFDNIIRLNKSDIELLEEFKDRIEVKMESQSGVISITVKMPDPDASAYLTSKCVDLLTKYLIDYKAGKARRNLVFIEERFGEAESDFEKIQKELALFIDRNANVSTSLAQIQMRNLQNEYNLSYEVYKGLATQLEQAKITVKEEMPVFTILEPITIPIEKSSPKLSFILVLSIILGLSTSSIYLLIGFRYKESNERN
jgi:uncharacterized protein involved in exopolysaccharide biosynthesis